MNHKDQLSVVLPEALRAYVRERAEAEERSQAAIIRRKIALALSAMLTRRWQFG
jgi:hypothetical protein